jgi:hypothetical protein
VTESLAIKQEYEMKWLMFRKIEKGPNDPTGDDGPTSDSDPLPGGSGTDVD